MVAVVVESCEICRPRGSGRIVVIRVEDTAKMSYAIIYFYFFSFSFFNFKIGLIHQASPPHPHANKRASQAEWCSTRVVASKFYTFPNKQKIIAIVVMVMIIIAIVVMVILVM